MAQWNWSNLGRGASPVYPMGTGGAITVQDSAAAAQRSYAFVRGGRDDLWVNWWTGTEWVWANQGPPFLWVAPPLSVITIQDGPGSAQLPHAFVGGGALSFGGVLLLNRWSGTQWEWDGIGQPSGSGSPSRRVHVWEVAAITQRDGTGSAQLPYVFVCGGDGNLWARRWTSPVDSKWEFHDRPRATPIVTDFLGAMNVRDRRGAAECPHAFVIGNDYYLHVRRWDGFAWRWQTSVPPPVDIIHGFGVTSVRERPQDPDVPHVFVRGGDGNLWLNRRNGTQWTWIDLGTPPGSVGISGPVGVTTVQDAPHDVQRPYVFVCGTDANLWLNWWG